MRLCNVENCEGEILGKSIYQTNGKLLLGAGFRINATVKAKLDERQITHVYVMEEGTEDVIPEDVISDEIRMQSRAKLADKVSDMKKQMDFRNVSKDKVKSLLEDGYLRNVNITYDLRSIVEEILKDISAAGAQFLNSVMIKSLDTYFLDHAVNTTIVAILLGRKYRFSKPELSALALGTFLHDIGKIVIDAMRNGDSKGDAGELYREHPTFGYLLVRNSGDISPMEAQVVNQHHERQDGGGFPIGLKGQNLKPIKDVVRETKGHIFRLAEICNVADAFENTVYNPRDKQILGPDTAIRNLIVNAGEQFNRDIVQTLLKVVPAFPVGAAVKLVDFVDPHLVGYRGVVARLNEKHINKPVIILTADKYGKKIKPMLIETCKHNTSKMELIL